MRNGNAILPAGAALLALTAQLYAGGFYLQPGNPDSAEARKVNAVVTVKVTGCHDPATAIVTATAVGIVKGERRSIPLRLAPLAEPGSYAISQQWPKEGRWAIQFSGRSDGAVTSTLVSAGPSGVDVSDGQARNRPFTADEVDAMLRR